MCDVSDPSLPNAYEDVRSDKTETNWCLLGYEGNAKIVLQGSGSNGIEELKGLLQDDQAQFGYLRVISGDAESRRSKFVFVSWCGEGVGALKRAKISVHKADIKKVLKEYAIEVHATTKDELQEEEILSRVKKAGGADYSGNRN